MNIYVSNLSSQVVESDLETVFSKFGMVDRVSIIKDRFSGSSRGFGFVEMPVKEEALKAIKTLSGTEVKGKPITVNEARPKAEGQGRERAYAGAGVGGAAESYRERRGGRDW